jgi:4-hydroxy-tetrahydrodipicolinate synthase
LFLLLNAANRGAIKMNQFTMPTGLWIPLVTPFRDGIVDQESLRRLVRHYAATTVSGIIIGATTGEGLFLDDDELELISTIAAEEIRGRMPLFMGIAGAGTQRVVDSIHRSQAYHIGGYLVAAPYYVRPSQQGLKAHFEHVAAATDRPIIVYNIPYRTGINVSNDTVLALTTLPNVVGIKDCCANHDQSFDLITRRPAHFSVLTGEDGHYLNALSHGANGAILASAHIQTSGFIEIAEHLANGHQSKALECWRPLAALVKLLFAEPNPGPIKYCLSRQGLIDSPEVRLPLTEISDSLKSRLDAALAVESVLR